jgi:hypothetical protein
VDAGDLGTLLAHSIVERELGDLDALLAGGHLERLHHSGENLGDDEEENTGSNGREKKTLFVLEENLGDDRRKTPESSQSNDGLIDSKRRMNETID